MNSEQLWNIGLEEDSPPRSGPSSWRFLTIEVECTYPGQEYRRWERGKKQNPTFTWRRGVAWSFCEQGQLLESRALGSFGWG